MRGMAGFFCGGSTYKGVSALLVRFYSDKPSKVETAKLLADKLKTHQRILYKKPFIESHDLSLHHSFTEKVKLDALARVLSFQDPCTGLVEHKGGIYVSYNDPKGGRLYNKNTVLVKM